MEKSEQIDALYMELHKRIHYFREEYDLDRGDVCWALECIKSDLKNIEIEFEDDIE